MLEPGRASVLTQDLLVDGVHFRLSETTPHDLGHKALAVNLSDLAAMGARPRAALVGIAAPSGALSAVLDDLYAGMDALAAEHGASIVGGDVTSGRDLVLAVVAVGEPLAGRAPVTRAGARPGDRVAVTGALGAATAGLRLLDDPDLAREVPDPAALLEAYHRPTPRVTEGLTLADCGASAMMDVSDGLAIDAERLALASGAVVEIDLERIPLAPGVAEMAAATGLEPALLAAGGGDDYELLVTAGEDALERAAERVRPLALGEIGRVVAGRPGVRLLRRGTPVDLDSRGWLHDV